MKAIVNIFFILIVALLGATSAFAAPHPPSPGAKTNAPPPPPGLPIDENISFLLLMAMLFGICIIYRYQLKTKAPI